MDKSIFIQILIRKCGLDLTKPVLLGFSGGPDSLCLLHLLLESGVKTIAVHVDHGLRHSSADEAAYVVDLCQKLHVPCISRRMDVTGYASQNNLSVEESARVLRYEYLFEEAARNQAQAVMVGHHADDQVETILMHLLRGSGLSGLAGMRSVLVPNPWSKSTPLVRPLLYVDKEGINRYIEEHKLEPVMDESNTDTRYFRNRIRQELVLNLATYNPQIKTRLLHMTEVVSVEDDYMMQQMEEAWGSVILLEQKHYLILDREKVSSLHPAILKRLIRKSIYWMDGNLRDVDFNVIERGFQFCVKPNRSNRVDLIAGIEMFTYLKRNIVIAYHRDPLHELWPQLLSDKNVTLSVPGETRVSDYWKLITSIRDRYEQGNDPCIGQLNAEKVTDSLVLSRFHPGDRFNPYGFSGKSIKLGDYWTSQGLPTRARRNWPLVQAGDEIVWIPGFRIAEDVQVDAHTKDIVRIELVKTEPVA